jgi:hypothetical protein
MAYVKSLDPTRPVGFASNLLNSRPGDDATALADFVLMNQYFGTWGGPKDRLGPALDAIHWIVVGAQDQKLLSQGNLSLPTLTPGTTWSTWVEWPVPTEEYVVTLGIIRRTGLTVLERSYDAQGNQQQRPRGQP